MLVRLRQQDWEFKTSLGHIVRVCLNKKEKELIACVSFTFLFKS